MAKKIEHPMTGFNDRNFAKDVRRLQDVALSYGYLISREEAIRAWIRYSEERSANWLVLSPDHAVLWNTLEKYLDII